MQPVCQPQGCSIGKFLEVLGKCSSGCSVNSKCRGGGGAPEGAQGNLGAAPGSAPKGAQCGASTIISCQSVVSHHSYRDYHPFQNHYT